MDLDAPAFSLSEVASAIDVDVGTLRIWVQRGHFKLRNSDLSARMEGVPHIVSLRRALQWGIAARLIKCGFRPAHAERAAYSFSDIADQDEAPGFSRDPGELFKSPAFTFLFGYPGEDRARVVRVDRNTKAESVLLAGLLGGPRANEGMFVWVNDVDRQVRTRLLQGGRDDRP